jgi:hypothetical protein
MKKSYHDSLESFGMPWWDISLGVLEGPGEVTIRRFLYEKSKDDAGVE